MAGLVAAVLLCKAEMTGREGLKGWPGMGNGRWEKNFKGVFPRHISGWKSKLGSINKVASLNFCRERWGPPTLNPPTPAQPSLAPSSPSAQPYLQIWSVESPSAESPAASLGPGGPGAQTMTVGSGRNMEVPGHRSTQFSIQPHPS